MKRLLFTQRKLAELSTTRATIKTTSKSMPIPMTTRKMSSKVHVQVPDNWNLDSYPIHNLKELEPFGSKS